MNLAMKSTICAVASGLALLGGAGASAADPPQPAPPQLPFVLPGTDTAGVDGYCPFGVLFTLVVNDEHVRMTSEPNGDTVETFNGHLVASVQNVNTGKTLKYNSSGPGVVTTHSNGSYTVDTHGGNLFYTTVRNTFTGPPAVPQIFYSTGHLVFTVAAGELNDNAAPTVAWALTGRMADVCAALAH